MNKDKPIRVYGECRIKLGATEYLINAPKGVTIQEILPTTAAEPVIDLSGLTPEQEKYIAKIREAENSYDPDYVIGGPQRGRRHLNV